jgi:hypothetical protein
MNINSPKLLGCCGYKECSVVGHSIQFWSEKTNFGYIGDQCQGEFNVVHMMYNSVQYYFLIFQKMR